MNYGLISFDDYEENDKPLIDFINLGKLSLENEEETDSLLLDFVNQYGLLNELYYKNEKYYEQVDMIVSYAQTLYNILRELKKEKGENIQHSLIEKLESNHIRTKYRE